MKKPMRSGSSPIKAKGSGLSVNTAKSLNVGGEAGGPPSGSPKLGPGAGKEKADNKKTKRRPSNSTQKFQSSEPKGQNSRGDPIPINRFGVGQDNNKTPLKNDPQDDCAPFVLPSVPCEPIGATSCLKSGWPSNPYWTNQNQMRPGAPSYQPTYRGIYNSNLSQISATGMTMYAGPKVRFDYSGINNKQVVNNAYIPMQGNKDAFPMVNNNGYNNWQTTTDCCTPMQICPEPRAVEVPNPCAPATPQAALSPCIAPSPCAAPRPCAPATPEPAPCRCVQMTPQPVPSPCEAPSPCAAPQPCAPVEQPCDNRYFQLLNQPERTAFSRFTSWSKS